MRGDLFGLTALASMTALGGCAVGVPHMGDITTGRDERVVNEQDLLAHIQCELHTAYDQAHDQADYDQEQNAAKKTGPNNDISWLDGWGVKVNLEFQVEAKSAITPGLAITKTLSNGVKTFSKNGPVTIARSRGASFGAGLTSDITRTETIAYFFPFSNFKNKRLLPPRIARQAPAKYSLEKCTQGTHIVSDDDLQIYDFLHSKLELAETAGLLGQAPSEAKEGEPKPVEQKPATPASGAASGHDCGCKSAEPTPKIAAKAPPKSPFSTLSYDVHFVVTKEFSATPMWKLVKVSIDSDGTLYDGTRAKSDHLTMTFGAPDPDKPDQASDEVNQQHFARLIGQYVGDAIRGHNGQ